MTAVEQAHRDLSMVRNLHFSSGDIEKGKKITAYLHHYTAIRTISTLCGWYTLISLGFKVASAIGG